MQRRKFCQLTGAALAAAALPAFTGNPPMQMKPIDPTPGGAFAHANEISNFSRLLFISGQVPEDDNEHVPPDYPSQYRLAWANVEKRLKAAGMTFDNLVKVTIFLSDRKLVAQSAGLRHAILGDRSPAITIIICGIYHEAWLLEIEAVAAA
jgi:2-iminobutanoate/2-iminopropanoate deaminase